ASVPRRPGYPRPVESSCPSWLRRLVRRQSEIERRSAPNFPLRPDASAVAPDDPGAGREADPAPLELAGGMQPLERFEQFVAVRHVEPGPVVANVIRLRAVGHGAAELDAPLPPAATVPPRVLQQVLQR